MRLNRFIAHAGVCSRRRADEMILEGLVKINDVVIWERGTMVAPRDKVSVNGKIITPEDKIYILLNKPDDVITTASDEKGRKTVLDLIDLPVYEQARIYPVGRLDRHTQGVLLLTNDGEMANRLMHPRYEVEKYYLVYTTEPVSPDQLKLLKKGVMLEEGIAKMDMVDYISTKQNELGVMLHEGKNRQIRRMLEVIGHEVSYLERVNYAGLDLKGIRRGKWRRLSYSEIRHLKALVKLK
jgi:23S rRNA pseudouridine2605 synthase